MQDNTLETDYLVIGAGAMGMAFTDVLVTETAATVVMVDRYARPGGHWTVAYPFVRLHQPSSFYGVNSRRLGSGRVDQVGWNRGLRELATGDEVCAYFERVMEQQFLPGGRVHYFPMCEYEGDGRFTSRVTGARHAVRARRVVDATYMRVSVPAMRPPPYEVAAGVACVPPNGLPAMAGGFDRFVVVGAGKTGMDACLWLLSQGLEPGRITWVMPRDSWLWDRNHTQPTTTTAESTLARFAEQQEAFAVAGSVPELLARLEEGGHLVRLDRDVQPTMFRCATVSRAELSQLRRVRDVIRLGRVRGIDPGALRLDGGDVRVQGRALFVDCTADGLERRPAVPVFAGEAITLQSVRTCQQVFSAALIAHVEATVDDVALKNRICTPIPHPDTDGDYVRTSLANSLNTAEWARHESLQRWLATSRLNFLARPGTAATPRTEPPDPEAIALAERLRAARVPAIDNLRRLAATLPP
jgi:hypothetical protein